MARKPAEEIEPGDGGEGRDSVALIASTKGVKDKTTLEALLAQVAELKKELGLKDEALTAAQAAALAAAEAQASFQQSAIQEVPSGRKMKVQKLDIGNEDWPTGYKTVGYKEDGRAILKPQFRMEAVTTYYYKLDIPPMAGWDMKINGIPLVHGATYEFDLPTLQYVKEMVARAWNHEAVINGKNENVFRKPTEKRIGSRA
jgi:hypothetical protein